MQAKGEKEKMKKVKVNASHDFNNIFLYDSADESDDEDSSDSESADEDIKNAEIETLGNCGISFVCEILKIVHRLLKFQLSL